MGKFIDLTGMKFGRLTVIELCGYDEKSKGYKWKCLCDCGTVKVLPSVYFKYGNTKSCGCLHDETVKKNPFKHGGRGTVLYSRWKNMRQRCNNKNNKQYKDYGGRGITICDEWDDFSKFREWALNNGYEENLQIDRIDVNGNYEPSNCRWADKYIQANNKRNNLFITRDGISKTAAEWSRETGVPRTTIVGRLFEHKGIDPLDTIKHKRKQPRHRK